MGRRLETRTTLSTSVRKVFRSSHQCNVTSGLSVTSLLYSNVMRIITGSRNKLQVTEREMALAEEINKDTRFVTQDSGHMGCHDRSLVKARDELKEKIEHATEKADKAKAAFKT